MEFNKELVNQYFPGATMISPTKIWKLPKEKESKLSEVCDSGKYFLLEKIDGSFYQFNKTQNYCYLFGRTVSVKNNLLTEKGTCVPHIMSALSLLPQDTVIIGEIYVPGGTSKNVTHFLGCLPQEAINRQNKEGLLHYYLHDIIYLNGENLMDRGAEERYNILKDIYLKYELAQYNFLRLATKVDTDLEAEISRILKTGGEGVVLKKRDAPYRPDKRKAWESIKIKQIDSIDLMCVGFCSATKVYTGKELSTWTWWVDEEDNRVEGLMYGKEGYIPVTKPYYYSWFSAIKIGGIDDQGNIVELGTVSSGLTDEDRKNISEHPDDYIDKVVGLDCMSVDSKSRTLRHPVFKGWREDKSAKDCLISEVFR